MWFVVWIVASIACGYYAKSKGISFGAGFFLAAILSPILGFVIVAVMKPRKPQCKYCKGYMEVGATVCKCCGREQIEE